MQRIASPLEPLYQSPWVKVVNLQLILVIRMGGLGRMEETVCLVRSRHTGEGKGALVASLGEMAGPGEVGEVPPLLPVPAGRPRCKIGQVVQRALAKGTQVMEEGEEGEEGVQVLEGAEGSGTHQLLMAIPMYIHQGVVWPTVPTQQSMAAAEIAGDQITREKTPASALSRVIQTEEAGTRV